MPGVTALPGDPGGLESLLAQVGLAEAACGAVVGDLEQLDDQPALVPVRVVKDHGLACVGPVVGPSRALTIHRDVRHAARACLPLLDRLDLRGRRKEDLRALAAASDAWCDPVAAHDREPHPGLRGLVEVVDRPLLSIRPPDGAVHFSQQDSGPSPLSPDVVRANAVTVTAWLGLFGEALRECRALRERVAAVLKPLGIKDRVRVDRTRQTVSVDGSTRALTEAQTTFIHYLVEAEGRVVSGPDIAKLERVGEFKSSRVRKSLERDHPDLARLVVRSTSGRRGFSITLPPPRT